MNNKIRRELIIEHLRDARSRLDLGSSIPRRRQAERHVRYWSDQLSRTSDAEAASGTPGAPAPA